MSQVIQTYVFIDLETTSLPKYENNCTKITEISMVAVKREHVLETRPGATPRVQHKITLCFNPGRMISDGSSFTTGLDNFLLEYEPTFNKKVFEMIDSFLSILTQPVCLIAQNGLNFDYPILKRHLVRLKVNFTADVLCADCYHGFYHILEKLKLDRENSFRREQEKEKEQKISLVKDTTNNKNTEALSILMQVTNETTQNDILTNQINDEKTDIDPPHISMQEVNETTPKSKNFRIPVKPLKGKRRLFPWGDCEKPKDSYQLKDIYNRVLNKTAVDTHRAENDCMFALEIAVALSKQFVKWVDENHSRFDDIEPMTIGVPI